MTDHPDPLVPAEVDLRNFGFMPLDVARLRDSELASASNAEVFRVAVLSWCVSWHQVPAASLPDDDSTLARMLGFGRDVRGWRRVRLAGGLRGWVSCSDGRLYHAVVAEKALEAWQSKQSQRARTEAARIARQSQRQSLLQSKQASARDSVTGSKGEDRERRGQGEGERQTAAAPTARSPEAGMNPDDQAIADALSRHAWAAKPKQVTQWRQLLGSHYRVHTPWKQVVAIGWIARVHREAVKWPEDIVDNAMIAGWKAAANEFIQAARPPAEATP